MEPDQGAEKQRDLSGFGQNHAFKEILYRLRDPQLVADTMIRSATEAWHLISPSEFSGLYRQVRRHTMCSAARLRALHQGVRYVVQNHIGGDLVECGCARGGSAALMTLTLRQLGERRKLWLFDTFEGLPAPTADDPDYEIAKLLTGKCRGQLEEVQELFQSCETADGVQFVKGLFQDTLPLNSIERIALLHIDGDWYDSVRICLESLYDKVVPGGIIQFDDYGYWKGARKAVDEFLQQRRIKQPLRKLDYSGRTLIKAGA
jgi:O-methyltransferase